MAIETTTPAAEAQAAAAASSETKALETKPATGTPEVKGVSGEVKPPAATPDATKKPDAAAPTTLLGKKLPPADPAKAAAEAPKDEKAKAEEYEVALPEGSLLNADHAKAMTEHFKKLGLTKDQATELAKHTDGVVKGYVEAATAQLSATEAGWWKELEAHPKYGGANLPESDKHATAALEKFFPGLKEELLNSPYAAHPKLFGGLVELGKAIADPRFRMNGIPPADKPKLTPAQELYGVDGKGKNIASKEGITK